MNIYNWKKIFFLLLISFVFFSVLLSCSVEEIDEGINAIWYPDRDPFRTTLPDPTSLDLSQFNTDLDKLKYLLQVVQGSMPVYATNIQYQDENELMESTKGDSAQLSERFIRYSMNFGYNGNVIYMNNDYIQDHSVVSLYVNSDRYIVGLNHGLIIHIQGNEYSIEYVPLKLPYYLPNDPINDYWTNTETLKIWFKEVRDYRWPKLLEDHSVSVFEQDEVINKGVSPMWIPPRDPFRAPLPDPSLLDLSQFTTDLDKLKYLLQVVQGSMPVYAPLYKYENEDEIMGSTKGDCARISERFIRYSKNFGYDGELFTIFNDYIPGHVVVSIYVNLDHYIVDLNDGLIVHIKDNSYTIEYTPLKIPYYLPYDPINDYWVNTENIKLWIEEVRDYRWPKYLEDMTVSVLE